MAYGGLDLDVRPVDPTAEDEMRRYQQLYVEAERAELPDATVYSLQDAVSVLSRAPLGRFYRGYAAFERGRMVGEGMLTGGLVDNLESAKLWAWVPPSERRRGVGSAVTEFMVDECRRLGRGILQTSAKYPASRRVDHPYRRFAEAHGFALANTQIERRLALPVQGALLDSLASDAAAQAESYLLRAVVGPIPVELAQGYCDVYNRLSTDAPVGDLVVEQSRRTPETLGDQDSEIRAQGRTRVTVLALDRAGSVVGFTCALVTLPGEPHVDQWATIVRSEDRGHRLGLALKVAQVRLVQERFGDKRFITTTNAETNAHMVAVNEALGFEPYAIQGEFQRTLHDRESARPPHDHAQQHRSERGVNAHRATPKVGEPG
ncbi:MAG: GNAT family N-acetyltransferase [Nocardioidaceae bacterium]